MELLTLREDSSTHTWSFLFHLSPLIILYGQKKQSNSGVGFVINKGIEQEHFKYQRKIRNLTKCYTIHQKKEQ